MMHELTLIGIGTGNPDHLTFEGSEVINEQLAVQMVDFVLNAGRPKTVEPGVFFAAIPRKPFHFNFCRTVQWRYLSRKAIAGLGFSICAARNGRDSRGFCFFADRRVSRCLPNGGRRKTMLRSL